MGGKEKGKEGGVKGVAELMEGSCPPPFPCLSFPPPPLSSLPKARHLQALG